MLPCRELYVLHFSEIRVNESHHDGDYRVVGWPLRFIVPLFKENGSNGIRMGQDPAGNVAEESDKWFVAKTKSARQILTLHIDRQHVGRKPNSFKEEKRPILRTKTNSVPNYRRTLNLLLMLMPSDQKTRGSTK